MELRYSSAMADSLVLTDHACRLKLGDVSIMICPITIGRGVEPEIFLVVELVSLSIILVATLCR